jgi:hypothetical protein
MAEDNYKLVDEFVVELKGIRTAVDRIAALQSVNPEHRGGIGRTVAGSTSTADAVQRAFAAVLNHPLRMSTAGPAVDDLKLFERAISQRFIARNVDDRIVYEFDQSGLSPAASGDESHRLTGRQSLLVQRSVGSLEQARRLIAELKPLCCDPCRDAIDKQKAVVRQELEELSVEFQRRELPRVMYVDRLLKALTERPVTVYGAEALGVNLRTQSQQDCANGDLGALQRLLCHEDSSNLIDLDDEEEHVKFQVVREAIETAKDAWEDYKRSQKESKVELIDGGLILGENFRRIELLLGVLVESVADARSDAELLGFDAGEQRAVPFESLDGATLHDFFELVERFARNQAPKFLRDGSRLSASVIAEIAQGLAYTAGRGRESGEFPFRSQGGLLDRAFQELEEQLDKLAAAATRIAGPCADWCGQGAVTESSS